MPIIIFLLLLLTCLHAQNFYASLSSSSQRAGATTTHFLTATCINQTIPAGAYLQLGYTAGWTVSSASRANSNDFCQNSCTLGSVFLTPSGSNIRISNLFSSAATNGYFSVGLSIQNIVNPSIAVSDSITLGLFDSGGTQLLTTSIQMTVLPSVLSCSAAPTNTTVSATTPYIFAIIPNANAPLPSSGSLVLTFPSQWINSLNGPAFTYSSCSNAASTVSCSSSGNTVTATGLFAATTTTAAFSFTLSNIISPGSTEPNSELDLQYRLANGSVVGSCSVMINSLVVSSLSGVSFSVESNVGVLKFTSLLPPMTTDELLLTFPSEYWLGDVENVVGRINGTISKPQIENSKLTSLNQLLLRPFFDNSLNSYEVNISNIYLLYPVQAPTITLSLTRFGYSYSSISCCSFTLAPSQTLGLPVTLSTSSMRSSAAYSFALTVSQFKYANYLIIDFCSQFTLTPSVALGCYLALQSGNQALNCTPASNSQLRVQLSNPSSTLDQVLGYQASSILVVTGITNPSQGSCSYSGSLYMSPSNLLQYSSTYTINYQATKIIQASLTLSSQVVGATAAYTFVVNNTNALSAGDQLHIYFPNTYTLTGVTCTFDNAAATFSILNTTHVSISIPSALAQYALAAHLFEVSPLTNPPSLRSSPAFALQLQSSGLVLESASEGVYAQLNTLTNFTSLTVTPSSLVAGQAASYTIAFSHSLTIPGTSTVKLSFDLPASYLLLNCSSCSSYATFTISSSTSSLTIDKVLNPQTTNQTSPIRITLSIDSYLSINDTVSSPSFTATPLIYSVTGNSSFLGETVTNNITISNLPLDTRTLIIGIPTQYTIGTVSLHSPQASTSHTIAGNTLNISLSTITHPNVTLVLQGLTTPTAVSSSAWTLAAFTVTQTLLASGTTHNAFSASCGSTCRQCINSSYCLSCYSNPAVNSLSLLDAAAHTCVNACSSSQFLEGSYCYSCNSTCLTCSLFASNCTSCSNSSFLLTSNCLSSCPGGYYPSGSTCTLCSNNCLTCSSPIACQSCVFGYILQTNSTCQTTCPSGQYNHSQVCTLCPSNCTSCSTSGCSACASNNYLVQTSVVVCLSACPQGLYVSANGSWCQQCQSPCFTCHTTSTNCTSCSSGTNPYLSSNQCLTVCPPGTYSDELSQCRNCMYPCSNCYSATNCSSCQNNTLLYTPLGQCVSACVSNTIQVGGECQECTSPCLTCSGSVTTCTSCISSYFLVAGNSTCTSNCSSPNFAYDGRCSACLFPCLTCSPSNTSKCFSCASTHLFFSFSCYTACPTHTYNDSASTCALCTPPCAECSLSPTNCTACYNDSSLLNNQCYSTCPANFFKSGGNCVGCQSQCSSCPYSAPYQCASCSSTSFYHNPQTYHCTSACSPPYYASTTLPLQCLPCQLPCKTCSSLFTQCSSCYFGNYLLNNACVSSCPSSYYQDSLNNVCVGCASLCATCTSSQCLTCKSGSLFYAGGCYSTCPAAAPYPYSIYCRNCLKSNCILCSSAGLCTLCQSGFFLSPDGSCVSVCPSDYQPDSLTSTRCIKLANVAFTEYIQYMEAMKILAFPGCLFFFLGLVLLPLAQIKMMVVSFTLSIPQAIVLAQFVVLFTLEGSKLVDDLLVLPVWLGLAIALLHFILSIGHVVLLWMNMLKDSKPFVDWMCYGSNECRFRTVFTFSFLSKQTFYLLFSGLFRLPMTTLQFKTPPRTFYLTHILYMLFQVCLVFISLLIVIPKQVYHYNSKLFYSAVDMAAVFIVSLVVDIFLLYKGKDQPKPTPYIKYILPRVSNYTLPAISEPPENPEGDNPQGLHRSGSDEQLFESQQMKNVDFRSMLDPNDFYDEVPAVDNEDIKDALLTGRFRKKNKKKRGERRAGGRLGIIEQESYEEEDEKKKKPQKGKRRKIGKQKDIGGLHNFIYWKKPKEKKANPGRVFRENEETIMSRIRQKESQFDTITQNDIVFHEQIGFDSSSEDYNFNEDSRRALQKPNKINYYDSLFNLNYAEKYHMDDSDQNQ